eukprot:366075-Chlamydomonas_euryale.AAC.1
MLGYCAQSGRARGLAGRSGGGAGSWAGWGETAARAGWGGAGMCGDRRKCRRKPGPPRHPPPHTRRCSNRGPREDTRGRIGRYIATRI